MPEITIGPFTLDTASGRMLRDGAEIRLRPQALQALEVLLRNTGRPVSYEQMIAEAWKGTHVSKHTVDVTVGEVKKTLGEYGRWITHRPKAGYRLEVPTSEELVRKGWHFYNRRTREGAELAIECFEHAAAECPGDARAFEGLSTCYLMLATFGMQPPGDVYPKFLETHEQAVALGGLRPELRCNRGHGLHLFEQQLEPAEAEFLAAIEEKPSLGAAYVRAALLYVTMDRLDDAAAMLDQLRAQGSAGADAAGHGGAAALLAPRLRRRDRLRQAGDRAASLPADRPRQLRAGARVLGTACRTRWRSTSWRRSCHRTCRGCARSRARAWPRWDGRPRRGRSSTSSSTCGAPSTWTRSTQSVLREALGHRAEAMNELERADDENSAFLYSMNVDPKMDVLPRRRAVSAARSGTLVEKRPRLSVGASPPCR